MTARYRPLLLTAAGFTAYAVLCGLFIVPPWPGKPAAGMQALSVTLAGPLLVVLTAGVARRTLLAACLWLLAACHLVAAVAAPPLPAAARLTAALLHPVLLPAALAVATAAVPARRKPQAIGAAMLGTVAGVVACWLLLQRADAHLARPAVLLAGALAQALAACLFYLSRRPQPVTRNSSTR